MAVEESTQDGAGATGGVALYYIEDGVHRAVALRENQVSMLPAILWEPAKAPRRLFLSLAQLHSPRAAVSMTPDPHHDLSAMIAWLSAPLGRSQMKPIHVQPLGTPGQSASIPLASVQITP